MPFKTAEKYLKFKSKKKEKRKNMFGTTRSKFIQKRMAVKIMIDPFHSSKMLMVLLHFN